MGKEKRKMVKENKILVTGGTGMVGRELQKIMPNAIYVGTKDCNLMNWSEVSALVKRHQPELIIHLAAVVGGIMDNLSDPTKYIIANTLMNTHILTAAHHYEVKKFIGMSSTCIYPDVMPIDSYPLKEECIHKGEPAKSNFGYAIAKRTMCATIDSIRNQYKCQYCYLIPCNLYGEYDNYDTSRSHFVAALIRKIYEAKKNNIDKIVLYGTGLPLRQFLFAADLAKVIREMILMNRYADLNVAPDETYSIDEIARTALHACDAEHLKIEYDTTKPDGQFRKDCSNKKLLNMMPDFNFTDLHTGLQETFIKYKPGF